MNTTKVHAQCAGGDIKKRTLTEHYIVHTLGVQHCNESISSYNKSARWEIFQWPCCWSTFKSILTILTEVSFSNFQLGWSFNGRIVGEFLQPRVDTGPHRKQFCFLGRLERSSSSTNNSYWSVANKRKQMLTCVYKRE